MRASARESEALPKPCVVSYFRDEIAFGHRSARNGCGDRFDRKEVAAAPVVQPDADSRAVVRRHAVVEPSEQLYGTE